MVEIRVRESEKQSEAGQDAERATPVTAGRTKVLNTNCLGEMLLKSDGLVHV